MKTIYFVLSIFLLTTVSSSAQLVLGGYGEVVYNQPLVDKGQKTKPGTFDARRFVMLGTFDFNDKTRFVTEVEFEHANEIFVEQLYLQHDIKPWLRLKAGMLLTPIGLINEYHEPTTFNGVERPGVDAKTLREIGIGFSGNIPQASLKYQAYLMNGQKSAKYVDGQYVALLSGPEGMFNARQKGIKAQFSAPNLASKVEFYGVKGLKIGASFYHGKTESELQHHKSTFSDSQVDSSRVNQTIAGLYTVYNIKALTLKGQYIQGFTSDTEAFNTFARNRAVYADQAEAWGGFYLEASYNVLKHFSTSHQLIPFFRLEYSNMHMKVDQSVTSIDAYENTSYVMGLGWKPSKGSILKFDYSSSHSVGIEHQNAINVGVGFDLRK